MEPKGSFYMTQLQINPTQNVTSNALNTTFIETYKKIEAFANKKFNQTGKYMPMSQLTDVMLSQLPGARDFATDLELFNNLRNLMQHKASDQYLIIQPAVVALIQHVYEVLTKTVTVGELFAAEVVFVPESADFSTVLDLIKRYHYTQFPVIRNGKVVQHKVITANALAHALTISKQPTVLEILAHSDAVVTVIQASDSIFTAEKILLDEVRNGHKSVVLLISKTQVGQKLRPADIIGLINLADLPQILSKK